MREAWKGELALFGVGVVLCGLLIVRAATLALILEALLSVGVYGALVFALGKREGVAFRRIRLVLAYLFTFWFYSGVKKMTPALGLPIQDDTLRGIDEFLFTEMPALSIQAWSSHWWTEIFSGCYLTYHIYLHCVLGWALWNGKTLEKLGNSLFVAFGIGFVGYLLVPAVGPAAAFPNLFNEQAEGYLIAKLNRFVVAQGSSTYDVFPSLHGLITATLLFFDFREHRLRFWVMLVPCVGLVVSTLYLRYHYAIDLLAGALCFIVVVAFVQSRGQEDSTGQDRNNPSTLKSTFPENGQTEPIESDSNNDRADQESTL